MKAILIDAVARTVSEVEFDGDYRSIYKLLSTDSQKVSTFQVLEINGTMNRKTGEGEMLFVDEEFLLHEPMGTDYFLLNGIHSPIGGSGLILGTDGDGESVATKLQADWVRANVQWRSLRVKDWTPTKTEENVDMPWGGKGARITSAHPIFEQIIEDWKGDVVRSVPEGGETE